MLKKCCSCEKEKPTSSYKKTSKTPDGKYPYCKECEWLLRVRTWNYRDSIAHRLYRELVSLIPNQASGKTHLYLNKDMFIKWLYMHPQFERLYHYYMNHLGTVDFHVVVRSKVQSLTFDNLNICLTDQIVSPNRLFDPESSRKE